MVMGPAAKPANHGFLLSNGALSTVDFPGSLDTVAYGINNKGRLSASISGTTAIVTAFD